MKKNTKKQKDKLLTQNYFDKSIKNFITKRYLDKKLDNFVTKDYLDKKLENFVTKDYLDKKLDAVKVYIDHKLEPILEFMKKFEGYHEKVMSRLDWLVGEYEKYGQEYTAMSERNNRVDGKLDNHEKRISILEKKTVYKTS